MSSIKKVPLIRNEKKGELTKFALMGFAVFVLLNFVNVYGEAKEFYRQARPFASYGIQELRQGAEALKSQNFLEAQKQFEAAEKSLRNLEEASRSLTVQVHDFLGQGLAAGAVEQLIEIGLEATGLGRNFAVAAGEWQKLPQTIPLDFFRGAQEPINRLWLQTGSLQKKVKTVSFFPLPRSLKSNIQKAEQELSAVMDILSRWRVTVNAALRLLGDKSPHHYLALLQNRNERRATGGFIGSYLLVTVNEGKITRLEPKDVYESDGQLTVKIPPPPGIDQVAETWGLRDANYSPDFPASAKKIMWFLERSRGPSVDTVVALDQTVAEQLLELTGPIEIPGFPFTIKAKNFDNILSFYTEAKLSKEKTPKSLLFDLISVMRKELTGLRDFRTMEQLARELIADGHIQLYSKDQSVQAFAEALKMDGRLLAPAPKTDYLAVISTSIGGNKSDRFIKMSLDHKTRIGDDGSVINTLMIKKTHTWQKTDWNRFARYFNYYGQEELSEKSLRFILGEGPNIDYLRVYVPNGSRLRRHDGAGEPAIVGEDLGYTVFAVPMTVKAGETKSVTLEYELPFRLLRNEAYDYRLITQHQAAAKNVLLNHEAALADFSSS